MKNINNLTKKALRFYYNYDNSSTYDIYDAYSRPSWRKVRAFDNIEKDMEKDNGYGLKICGFNSCTFSAAYKRIKYGVKQLIYYTPDNVYVIDIDTDMLLVYEIEKGTLFW